MSNDRTQEETRDPIAGTPGQETPSQEATERPDGSDALGGLRDQVAGAAAVAEVVKQDVAVAQEKSAEAEDHAARARDHADRAESVATTLGRFREDLPDLAARRAADMLQPEIQAAVDALHRRIDAIAADVATLKAAPPAPAAAGMPLSDLRAGGPDSNGNHVLRIIFQAAGRYAVYRAIEGQPARDWLRRRRQEHQSLVLVHLSDDPKVMATQLDNLAGVNDLRTRVGGLINGQWRNPSFERTFGAALGSAAEFGPTQARAELEALRKELETESHRIGQAYQMAYSCVAVAIFVLALYGFSDGLRLFGSTIFAGYPFDNVNQNVWAAARGGAVGAWFSIATAFSRRALAPDTQKIRIALDAFIRIGSGVIAGGAILLVLTSGMLTKPLGGDAAAVTIGSWMYVVALGFLAGFVERLVPNLFDSVQITPAGRPATGGGATGGGATGGGASGAPQSASTLGGSSGPGGSASRP